MRITRYTHACVRVDDGDRALVIDPGIWSEPHALIGVDAVLITHEHYDHIDVLRLACAGVPVYLARGARLPNDERTRRLNLHRVDVDQQFEAAGFAIRAVGGTHAPVFDGASTCANLGYLVDGAPGGPLYHPRDSLHVPHLKDSGRVGVLCVPVQASSLKLTEAIDFTLAVAPQAAIGIHDGQVNERGLEAITHHLTRRAGGVYQQLAPGKTLA